MPEVFTTGFLVDFLEWACIKAITPYLDSPEEQTLGSHINVSHQAATPIGLEVTAIVELVEIDWKKLTFNVQAHDDIDLISTGRHERFIINRLKFDDKLNLKRNCKLIWFNKFFIRSYSYDFTFPVSSRVFKIFLILSILYLNLAVLN